MNTSKISDIEQLDRDFQGIMEWSPVPPGSLLRVHEYSYGNWGIEVTPENVEWLYEQSRKAYECEWGYTDGSLNLLVAKAAINAGLGDVNAKMNSIVGKYAAQYIIESLRDGFVMVDIGAGTGPTTVAVLENLIGSVFSVHGRIILIEPSEKRLQVAGIQIQKLLSKLPGIDMSLISNTDVEALRSFDPSFVDIVISNGTIHHNSFNRHLPEILRVLKPLEPFINGDWYNGMWEKPERVYWLLLLIKNCEDEMLKTRVLNSILMDFLPSGINEFPELTEFRRMLGLSKKEVSNAFFDCSDSERRADVSIMKFWVEVAKLFTKHEEKSPIFFLESHERVSRRKTNLRGAGFVFNSECRIKYKELLRKRGKGELSAVMVAKRTA